MFIQFIFFLLCLIHLPGKAQGRSLEEREVAVFGRDGSELLFGPNLSELMSYFHAL